MSVIILFFVLCCVNAPVVITAKMTSQINNCNVLAITTESCYTVLWIYCFYN